MHLFATLLARDLPEFLSQGISPLWIPIVTVVSGCLMVVGIVAVVHHHKQQIQRLDYELQLRRMEHERRMKELELELAKVKQGGAEVPR